MTVALSPPTAGSALDPLATLREYRSLAPWGLRDLTALAAGILDASGIVPVSAVARSRPTERTQARLQIHLPSRLARPHLIAVRPAP